MSTGSRALAVSIVFVALQALFCQQAAFGQAVAKVNGTVLSEADLEEVMARLIPQVSFHRNLTTEKRAAYRSQAFEDMIDAELFYQAAKAKGMVVEKDAIKRAKEAAVNRVGGKKQFKAALKQAGISEKQFESKVEKRILVQMITEAEVTRKAAVTDEEVRANYDRNVESYMRPDARKIKHILISVPPEASVEERERRRRRAAEVLEKAGKGEDFSRLAWDYSDDAYKVKGGDLGIIHRGRLDSKIEEVVFKLKAGELSGIIETIYGYHIVLMEEVKEPEQLSFEDVSQGIRKKMTEKRLRERKEEFTAQLRANAVIEEY